jgi:hypothetical protein
MMNRQIVRVGAFGFLALAASAARAPLGAQERVQLAFGYECDDRFMIKNDGASTVTLEYGLEGRSERTKLSIKGKESVEIDSKGPLPVELFVDGRRVAKEAKGNRDCATTTPTSADQPTVVVRPLDPRDDNTTVRVVEPVVVRPQVVYVDPWYDPFWYPRVSLGIGFGRPYYGGYYGGYSGGYYGGRGIRMSGHRRGRR